jgi:hypothetical protein
LASSEKIWRKLKDYGLDSEEIRALCIRMLEVTHKRKVLVTFWHNNFEILGTENNP